MVQPQAGSNPQNWITRGTFLTITFQTPAKPAINSFSREMTSHVLDVWGGYALAFTYTETLAIDFIQSSRT